MSTWTDKMSSFLNEIVHEGAIRRWTCFVVSLKDPE